MNRCLLFIVLVCSVPGVAGLASANDDNEQRVSGAWHALRSGQAVILMRHALAPGIGDPAAFELGKCSTQRNLSEAGRLQALQLVKYFAPMV